MFASSTSVKSMFTAESARAAGLRSGASSKAVAILKPLKVVVQIQRLIEMATDRDGETLPEAKDIAAFARAFRDLEELKCRLLMKPAPKPVDTTKAAPRSPRAPGRAKFAPAPVISQPSNT